MRAVIGLGANLGQPHVQLDAAVASIGRLEGVRVLAQAPRIETSPVGGPTQPNYVNGALLIDAPSSMSPVALVEALLAIEAAVGRVRSVRNAARPVDLDLLWTDGPPSLDPRAQVPHPRLATRAFALVPLLALVPDARDPDGVRYADHLARCSRDELLGEALRR
jgi:2-amino-4-hydroxy-6-hydroxymethyldihydropteridine diphosphokinase